MRARRGFEPGMGRERAGRGAGGAQGVRLEGEKYERLEGLLSCQGRSPGRRETVSVGADWFLGGSSWRRKRRRGWRSGR